MKLKDHDGWFFQWAGFWFSMIPVALVALIIYSIVYDNKRTAALHSDRLAFCSSICVANGSEPQKVKKQKIGFGAFEYRCFCTDGAWRPIF